MAMKNAFKFAMLAGATVACRHAPKVIKAGTSKARKFVCRGKDTSAKAGASEGASGATADLVCCFQPEETGDIKQHVKETYIEAVVVDAQGCNDTSEGIAAPEDPIMEAEQEERSSLLSTAAFLVQHLIITTLIMVFLAYTWPLFLSSAS
jgi:hypothetical protein